MPMGRLRGLQFAQKMMMMMEFIKYISLLNRMFNMLYKRKTKNSYYKIQITHTDRNMSANKQTETHQHV